MYYLYKRETKTIIIILGKSDTSIIRNFNCTNSETIRIQIQIGH